MSAYADGVFFNTIAMIRSNSRLTEFLSCHSFSLNLNFFKYVFFCYTVIFFQFANNIKIIKNIENIKPVGNIVP